MKLALDNIHKRYGKREVVSRVSLTVNQGEIVGLLGPNGAGKTTTFYIATGVEQPDQGKVCLDHQEITHLPIHERARLGIGYLHQKPSIFRGLTVRDNILLVLQQTNVPQREWRPRLNRLLEEFHLGHVASTLGMYISGGEQRRTEIARALATGATGPKFLLLDEPFAGVDPIAVADVQDIVRRLVQRNIGVLVTDHNVRETLAITDRAYIMREGKILAAGSAEDLYTDPSVRQYYLGQRFQR
ncbi:LPS export ABC transporter ATP-binding protein [Leptolyngbya sp. FACHB-261]|uniref:LPS export ABC transporter ATP-binding protein n=1 Tax=Leptolyngbya sp. FACHB-261 TaxID=2692806 RepID=UPI0016826594|nr:LPS export ABC transporter ATP-binding protein [Leptolyngbya sp. FACHB-261]MBD2103830.1 LPS export ABC transporter ATP-binding protein [Leptolyngbya sp. FACHB-261]